MIGSPGLAKTATFISPIFRRGACRDCHGADRLALSPVEWAYVVNDTKAKIVFAGAGFDELAEQFAGMLEHDPRIITDGEARALIDIPAQRICAIRAGRCGAAAVHLRNDRQAQGRGTIEPEFVRVCASTRTKSIALDQVG